MKCRSNIFIILMFVVILLDNQVNNSYQFTISDYESTIKDLANPSLNDKLKSLIIDSLLPSTRKHQKESSKIIEVDKNKVLLKELQSLLSTTNTNNSDSKKIIDIKNTTNDIKITTQDQKLNKNSIENSNSSIFKEVEAFRFKSGNVNEDQVEQKIERKTEDGRLCAKSFVQDGKTYTDCTKSNLPTGKPTDKEWCYVTEELATTGSKWDYCLPILDYNRVRSYNFIKKRILNKLTIVLTQDIIKNISPAKETIDSAIEIQKSQRELSNKINQLKKDTVEVIEKVKKNIDSKIQMDKLTEELKDLTFKLDTLTQEGVENPKNFDCSGMLLYEDKGMGDGVMGYYYDNDSWIGNPIISKDETINFDWTGTSPIKGTNPHNFSIIWEGFIVPPYTGEYFFTLHADNGGVLFINDKAVISHNNGSITDKGKNKMVNINKTDSSGKKVDPFVSKSQGIRLIGENKVKLKLAYFHSIHYTPFKDNKVNIKLQWESDEFNIRDIKMKDLYSVNSLPPLKVTDYDTDQAILRKLHEGDDFFKDSNRYIIQDIPYEFRGASSLKFKKRYIGNDLYFQVNTKCIVYIGILEHYPNPLPGDFMNSGYKFQLLQIENITKTTTKKFIASKASPIDIYQKEFSQGVVRIPLSKNGLNKHGVNLIIFFGFNSTIKKPIVCEGDELIPSLSTSVDFKSCTASSEKPNFECEAGFSNRNIDEDKAMWASDNDGVGAWIKVNFNGLYELTKFTYKNRMNPAERNSKLELVFSTGDILNINLSNSDKLENYKLEPIRAHSVKITITGVYGTLNNGGAFNFYGYKCNENSNIKMFNNVENDISTIEPLFSDNEDSVISLTCRESLTNTMKFDNIDLTIDKKITVRCPESCVNYDIPVYGSNLYSEDSSICKAAFHSLKISSNGGLVSLVIKPGTKHYKATLSNGIRTSGKQESRLSMMFEFYKEEDIIIVKAGSKIDLKMDTNDVKEQLDKGELALWQPAVIVSVIETSNGKFVKLMLDGSKLYYYFNHFFRKLKGYGFSLS